MKKTLTLILIGVLIGSTATLATSRIFSDVPPNVWYTSAVSSLSEKGIIGGYPDGTYRPGNNVTRAELAVMLDHAIEYSRTGKVTSAPSNTSISERAFDGCGPLSKYKDYAWFPGLNEKYAAGNYMEDSVGVGSEACLSLDGGYFVFIPEDFASASKCGSIFSYDIASGDYNPAYSALTKATGPSYCAQEFQERVGSYIKFTGQSVNMTNATCTKTNGKYYYLENRVEVTNSSC